MEVILATLTSGSDWQILRSVNNCSILYSKCVSSLNNKWSVDNHMYIHRHTYVHVVIYKCLMVRDGNREPLQTGLSIAVNQSKTGPPSKRFGFLCMHRVPGGVIKRKYGNLNPLASCNTNGLYCAFE